MIDRSLCPADKHGKYWHYDRWNCRCPDAREAALLRRMRIRKGRHQPLNVDATGTRRRLQALAAMGWPADDISVRSGISVRTIRSIYSGATTVRRSVADAATALYNQLGLTEGPGRLCKTRARNRGWVTALAWDDDTIDDPTKRPRIGNPARAGACDHVAVLRAVTGDGDAAVREVDRREAVRLLASARVPDADIADRLGTTPAAVKQLRYRHGMTRGRAGVAA